MSPEEQEIQKAILLDREDDRRMKNMGLIIVIVSTAAAWIFMWIYLLFIIVAVLAAEEFH